MATNPSGQEKQYYDQLFDAVSKDTSGLLPGSDALPLLTASGLPQQTLGEIWTVADPDNNGFLTRDTWYKAARLVGWLQNGGQTNVDASLANKTPPFPTFKGYPVPGARTATPVMPLSANTTGQQSMLPLTAEDRTQFTRVFVGCGPQNGLVSGDKARDVFLKSRLSYDKLGQIWNLADTQQRGALDLPDFIIGMWLIRNCMGNPSLSLPPTLPPGAYEAASGGRPQMAPLSVQNTGQASPLQRQMTGTPQPQPQPQLTGQSMPTTHAPSHPMRSPTRQGTYSSIDAPSATAWDITPEAKATSDRFFAQLDTQNKGVIEGDIAVSFMLLSQLDEASLATIWDLSDIRQEGKLDRDEFAVASHLISSKLAGKELPVSLPQSLIPPSLRSRQSPAQPQRPTASQDLLGIFDDSPEQSSLASTPATAFLPQPPSRRGTTQESTTRRVEVTPAIQSPAGFGTVFSKSSTAADLLGDDAQEAAASGVPDTSAEIGNKRNQLANTTRSVVDLERNRSDLEQRNASNSSQLEQLESELATARTKYDEETKIVAELRIRVGEQTARLRQLQADVISAQSDLTARKMEKDELEQTFLRDKEEVRGLQKRMKEIEDEKTGIRLLLEKVKKDARQQKGMVSIAKKQLSTAEGSRDSLQQELRQADNPAAADETEGLDATPSPRTLSPAATGTSQRSYNPFDRLNRQRSQGSASGSISEFTTPHATQGLVSALAVGGAAAAGVAAVAHLGSQSDSKSPTSTSPAGERADLDAFGAPVGESSTLSGTAVSDPFGTASADNGLFSAPSGEAVVSAPTAGFGDSFHSTVAQHLPTGAASTANDASDFDTAFADFDTNVTITSPVAAQPQPGDTIVVEEDSSSSGAAGVTRNVSKPAASDVFATEVEPTTPTQEMPASSNSTLSPLLASSVVPPPVQPPPVGADELGEESSEDEDDGPEDLEGPRRGYTAAATRDSPVEPSPTGSPPIATSVPPEETHHKTRRTAPPPPSVRPPGAASPPVLRSPDPASPNILSPGAVSPPSARSPGMVSPPVARSPRAASPSPTSGVDPFGAVPASQTVGGPPAAASPPLAQPPSGGVSPVKDDSSNLPEGQDPFGGSGALFKENAPAGGDANQFDDGEFDFPDVPVATSAQNPSQAPATTSFDDEFATFDEDFDKAPSQLNSNSDQSNSLLQSYEVVTSPNETGTSKLDEWGLNSEAKPASGGDTSGFSFDDAFHQPQLQTMIPGGFDDAFGQSQQSIQQQGNAQQDSFNGAFGAPRAADGLHSSPSKDAYSFDDAFGVDPAPGISGPSNAGLAGSGPSSDAVPAASGDVGPPALPKRPSVHKEPSTSDLAQADDVKDVKKLCELGFPRSLVVEALAANGYDFQEALNVLLVK